MKFNWLYYGAVYVSQAEFPVCKLDAYVLNLTCWNESRNANSGFTSIDQVQTSNHEASVVESTFAALAKTVLDKTYQSWHKNNNLSKVRYLNYKKTFATFHVLESPQWQYRLTEGFLLVVSEVSELKLKSAVLTLKTRDPFEDAILQSDVVEAGNMSNGNK